VTTTTLPVRPPSVHQQAINAGLIVLHVKVARPNIEDIESAVYVLASQVVKVETRYSESGKPLGATVETSGGHRVYARETAEAVVSLLARMREASRVGSE